MRHFASLAAVTSIAALATGPALGQEDIAKAEIKVTDVGHNIHVLSGAGGNITMAVGSDGIIVVDTEFAVLHDKIKAAMAGISQLPVKFVIDTHYHPDHTNGNEMFAKEGAITVAHENVAKRIDHPPVGFDGKPNTPAPKGTIPAQTYTGQGTEVKIPGQTAELVHVENAHTDGDTVVFWQAADVVSTGDVVGSATYPNIDVPAGGGIDGMIAADDFIIAHTDAKTVIIPGHGPVTDKKGLVTYRNMMKTARDRIAKAKAKGMSEDQVAQAHLLADFDKRWLPPGNGAATRFPRNVYRSLK
jgi:cyclase